MSKYIKLEDALKGLNMGYGKYDYVSKVADYYNNLPTIEVSEDCISREFALEVISDYVNYPTEGDKVCAIKNAPSVTTEQSSMVGEWVIDEYGIPHCSECNCINNTVYRNYCPNCGAKMKGADDERP